MPSKCYLIIILGFGIYYASDFIFFQAAKVGLVFCLEGVTITCGILLNLKIGRFMKIAIHASDLCHQRIDGTRVYILNMLKNFGKLDKQDSFFVYHKNNFNPALKPPSFPNYFFKNIPFPRFWTQTRFAWQLFRDKPGVLWMPVHNLPHWRRKKMKTVVTVHDLAFKIFPQYFPVQELSRLNKLGDHAIQNADGLIAISHATKEDILKFYPTVKAEKIKVIHHGFDAQLFNLNFSESQSKEILKSYNLQPKSYLLYVGAIQPRKNLVVLIEAFEQIKVNQPEMKLVIAGATAWNYQETLQRIKDSVFANDIVVTNRLPFDQLPVLYQGAIIFVFPSLYEGFGIPVLEAMACGVPVVLAKNSSLPEVGGCAASYFDAKSCNQLATCIEKVLKDKILAQQMIQAGLNQARKFSWEKSAQETLQLLKSIK